MDIKRAIEILDPEHREHYESIEVVNEACRMGMEALRKLRETQEGDFISRDAVISEIKGVYEWHDFVTAERLIQHIKNLPTADAKPELASQSSAEGLKQKYSVFKSDTGEEVENCFVLKPAKDLAAVKALRAYAAATENRELSEDIYNWVGKPVSDSEQGDYIGREEIIKRIRSTKWPDYIKDVLIEEVTLIPAADVRTVEHGKWVWDGDTLDWEKRYFCNRCEWKTYKRSDYCPNCGAKMEVQDG